MDTRSTRPWALVAALLGATALLVSVPAFAQERLAAPARTQVLLAPETAGETAAYILEGDRPGPVVAVVGGLHGDQPASWMAAEVLAITPVRRGTLLVIPHADPQAVAAGVRSSGEDLNRSFPQEPGEAPTTPVSRDIYELLRAYPVDWLVDLHEGPDYQRQTPGALGNSILYHPEEAGELASGLADRLSRGLPPEQAFVLLRNPIRTGLVRSAADTLGIRSLYLSTTLRDPLYVRVELQVRAVLDLLEQLEML